MRDFWYGWRAVRRNPGFALTAILTLTLGIGSATMVFSVVNAVLFNALPYQAPDRLVTFDVQQANYNGPPDYGPDEFRDFKNWMPSLEEAIGFARTNLLYRNGLGAQEVRGAWITTNAFPTLGVSPHLGRFPPAGDENVCVISDLFWREQFHADPGVVGKTLNFDGTLRTVAGVMPPRFRFAGADVWIPHSGNVRLFPLGRLKVGATVESATRDFDAAARRMADAYQYPGPKQFTVSVRTLLDSTVGSLKQALYAVFAAVGLLLLIACANVGNLLLVRATAREKEIAIRGAMGASRGRLIRQLLIESLLLAATGGLAGGFLAWWGLGLLATFLPLGALPGEVTMEMNDAVLGFAVALTLITTLLCGLAPALRATRSQANTQRDSSGLRAGLVIAEVAIAMVLLIGAGLMARTFFAITHVDLGFDATNILHLNLVLPAGRYDNSPRQQALIGDILGRIRRTPGVLTASVSRTLPPFDEGSVFNLDVPGKRAMLAFCDENYFRTLGRPLLRGRLFNETDSATGRQVMLVNETFVRAYFNSGDAVGRTVRFDFGRATRGVPLNPDFEVIGVVSDAKNQGPREPVMPQGYLPYHGDGVILVKTSLPPFSLVETIRRQIWAVDSEVAMTRVGTIEQSINDNDYAQPRFGVVSIGSFAGIGLVLIAVGVFSVMAYSVSARTREIGIRMALGAHPEQILNLVLGKGLMLVAAGVAIGVLASLALTRLLASQLWGVSPTDRWTFAGVSAVLLVSGMAACFLPALRASRVDPTVALRHE